MQAVVVGEAISLPLASNLIEIIFERTAPNAEVAFSQENDGGIVKNT